MNVTSRNNAAPSIPENFLQRQSLNAGHVFGQLLTLAFGYAIQEWDCLCCTILETNVNLFASFFYFEKETRRHLLFCDLAETKLPDHPSDVVLRDGSFSGCALASPVRGFRTDPPSERTEERTNVSSSRSRERATPEVPPLERQGGYKHFRSLTSEFTSHEFSYEPCGSRSPRPRHVSVPN